MSDSPLADVFPDRVNWCSGVGCEDIATEKADYTNDDGQVLHIPLCSTCLALANTESGIETETVFFVKLRIGEAKVADLLARTADKRTTACSLCGGAGTMEF